MPTPPALVLGPLDRALPRILAAADDAPPDKHVLRLGALWQREVDRATRRWQTEVSPVQLASLEAQLESAVQGGSAYAVAHITAPVLGADVLLEPMRAMAGAGAAAVVAEARDAGVTLPDVPPLAAVGLAEWAQIGAESLAGGYAAGVAREALRLFRPGAAAAGIIAGVRAYAKKLTDRAPRDVVGASLTRAQNLGRLDAYRHAPPDVSVILIADETNDARTCGPCRKIDGTQLPTPEAAALAYGGAGYLFCEGGSRCRGTVRAHWERAADPLERAFITIKGGAP